MFEAKISQPVTGHQLLQQVIFLSSPTTYFDESTGNCNLIIINNNLSMLYTMFNIP